MFMNLFSILLAMLILLLVSGIRIMREYERAVVFLLGRFYQVKGPGLIFIIPVIQQMVKVDLRTIVMDVPTQDVISRDNVSVKVSAIVFFRVIEPEKAVIQVEHYYEATSQMAQTTLARCWDSTSWTKCWRTGQAQCRHPNHFGSADRILGDQGFQCRDQTDGFE